LGPPCYHRSMLYDAAVHEAAHAVVAVILGFRVGEVKVWRDGVICRGRVRLELGPEWPEVEPPPDDVGMAMSIEADPDAEVDDPRVAAFRRLLPGKQAMDYLTMSVAGRTAQARVLPEAEVCAGADIASEQWVIDFALSERQRRLGARERAAAIANLLLDLYWDEVLRVAQELRRRRRLDGAEVLTIIGNTQ
jgi:hypothetical protein